MSSFIPHGPLLRHPGGRVKVGGEGSRVVFCGRSGYGNGSGGGRERERETAAVCKKNSKSWRRFLFSLFLYEESFFSMETGGF